MLWNKVSLFRMVRFSSRSPIPSQLGPLNRTWVRQSLGVVRAFLGLPWWLSSKESTYECRRPRFNSWMGRSPGEGNGNPLQYSCLKNPMDRGAWWDTVHGGRKESDTTERLQIKKNPVLAGGFFTTDPPEEAQCTGHSFNPWSGKIPHFLRKTRPQVPQLLRPKSRACSLQVEKACM